LIVALGERTGLTVLARGSAVVPPPQCRRRTQRSHLSPFGLSISVSNCDNTPSAGLHVPTEFLVGTRVPTVAMEFLVGTAKARAFNVRKA
jgi:hypothetical protein